MNLSVIQHVVSILVAESMSTKDEEEEEENKQKRKEFHVCIFYHEA
jgi:hypothetical protein